MANHNHDNGSDGLGFLFGILILIAFIFALWYWGMPAIQRGTQINVPSKIDVNINQQQPAQ